MAKKYTNNYKLELAYGAIFNALHPKDWIPIHEVLDITSGDGLPKHKMKEGPYPVYGGGGLTESTHSEFNIELPTIGIGRVGARCGCVFEIKEQSWVTDNALVVGWHDPQFHLPFLRHFLSHLNLGSFANNAMQPVISKTRIAHVRLPELEIDEQEFLAELLDAIELGESVELTENPSLSLKLKAVDNWEALCSEIVKQKTLVSQLKQSILQEAIEGKLTADWRKENSDVEPASELLKHIKAEKARLIKEKKLKKEKPLPPIAADEIPFELPDGWVWCRFGQVAINRDELRQPISQKEREGRDKLYDYYGASGKIDMIDSYTHDGVFLLIGEDGSNLRLRSKPIAFKAEGKFWVNNHAHTVQFFDNDSLEYMESHLNGMDLTKYITGGFQPKLSQGKMNEILVALPPLVEQKAINDKVESLLEKCRLLEAEITQSDQHAQQLMQAVLKEAFEGGEPALLQAAEPKAGYGKVIQLERRKCERTERPVLAGHIILRCASSDFGRTKLMKLLYLVEQECDLDLETEYLQYAAGPYDETLIRDVEQGLQRFGLFNVSQNFRSEKKEVTYTAKSAAQVQLEPIFYEGFSVEAEKINALLDKFRNKPWYWSEIIATLYAVWNNRLLLQQPVEDALLKQDFLNWSEGKARYKEQLDEALLWMRRENILPKGWGKVIKMDRCLE